MATATSAPPDVSAAGMAPSRAPFPARPCPHLPRAVFTLQQKGLCRRHGVRARETGRQLASDVAAMGATLREELGVRRGERVCILGLDR